MRQLRILIVTFTFPPNKDGVAESARSMAENFAARGHSVTVATGYHPGRDSEVYGNGVRVKQFQVAGSPNLREGIHGDVEAFKKFVGSFKGDVVIVQCWHVWSSALAEEVFPQLTSARKILMSHGFAAQVWVPHRRFPWGIGQWLGMQPWFWTFPWRLRKYDQVVVNTERADCNRFMDHLIAKMTRYRKITVIPNSTDPDQFHAPYGQFRRRRGLGNRLLLLNVANYSERKNQELAVRAFARAALDDAVLVFIGAEFNSYSQRAQRAAAELGLRSDQVLFLDQIAPDETRSAFIDCDIFVLSSKAETQPFVLIEAMACAKPFVTTNTGCVREFPGGYVVRTERQMADRFRQLAEDSGLRQRLGQMGRSACLAKYTAQRVGERWMQLLERMTS